MALIKEVKAREVLDSRGNPTVECEILLEDGSLGKAMVPSGASTGAHEAKELRDGGKRYLGKGVLNAVSNIRKAIATKIIGREAEQKSLDAFLLELDGTPNKQKLGANAILAVSLASARASSASERLPLYAYLQKLYGSSSLSLPVPFANLINGSRHAGNDLAFQEFMIVPIGFKHFGEAARAIVEIYQTLKASLEKRLGRSAINVGDEGGFAPPLQKTEEALETLWKAVQEAGYANQVKLALDVAATSIFREGMYFVDGQTLSSSQLQDFYTSLLSKFPIISIEDPFFEEDFASFASITKQFPNLQVVADDLTVTNVSRLQQAIQQKAGNCLLLKVNQVGTLSESLEAAKLALQNKWGVMVSHRSGETEDSFISDLAVALDCRQIKLGAPCRSERTAKYNRLLRIEEEQGEAAKLAWIR